MRFNSFSVCIIVLLVTGLFLGGCATTNMSMIDATLEKAAKLRVEAESSPNVGLVQKELRDSRAQERRANRYVQNSINQPLFDIQNKDRLLNRAKTAALSSVEAAKMARDKAVRGPVVMKHPKKPVTIIQPVQQPRVTTQTVQQEPAVVSKPEPPAPLESKPASVSKPARSSAASLASKNPGRTYREALDDYYGRRFGQARMGFSDFLAANPSHKLAANAQYWLAETYYAEGNWSKALAAFQKVRSVYPGSRKDADALCKVGLTQRNLGRQSQAKASLNKCIDNYPKSRAAGVARQALDRMS